MYFSNKGNTEKITKSGGKFRDMDSEKRNKNKKLNKPQRSTTKRNYEY